MTTQPQILFHCLVVFFCLSSCSPWVSPSRMSKALQGESLFAVGYGYAKPDSSDHVAIESAAKRWLGVPYLWGGEGPDSIDCSAYMQKIFAQAMHIELPRRAAWQALVGVPVARVELRFGDLVFFGTDDEIDHVGMYWDDGWFINATVTRGVAFSHLEEPFWAGRFRLARRLVKAAR